MTTSTSACAIRFLCISMLAVSQNSCSATTLYDDADTFDEVTLLQADRTTRITETRVLKSVELKLKEVDSNDETDRADDSYHCTWFGDECTAEWKPGNWGLDGEPDNDIVGVGAPERVVQNGGEAVGTLTAKLAVERLTEKQEASRANEFMFLGMPFDVVIAWMFRLCLQAAIVYILWDGSKRWRSSADDVPANVVPERNQDQLLLRAVLDGDVVRCQALIEEGADVGVDDIWGSTALHSAAVGRGATASALVSLLLQRGANVNARDAMEETPLHFAARADNVEVCEKLLAYGAQLDAVNVQAYCPLVVAANEGNETVCSFFLGHGAMPKEGTELPPLLHRLMRKEEGLGDMPDDGAHYGVFGEDR
mmetsp:Transcript_40277/g.110852  ORF Transcript_40277/g.110852 Transcript_40277/m.110852 type:complete len:366 (+) Transcript_40277:103-1200(+)|eukprot:CAMPEP_0117555458 /NCGR_PEP_ID=MMETSP0784-20121206/51285_1 /TAXON_ID=39447 /ORGANISM="" /LENGTH=365 /DNA_ID=CAMNT_0005352665 /DNA_START=34 /DNA_END=1131 /DNA_ORIENTATION=+